MPKTPEAELSTSTVSERTPEDLQALDVRRKLNRLIDQYEIKRSKYELVLISQDKIGPPTAEQIELKQELHALWNEIHDMEGEIAEHEFMAQDKGILKSLTLARKEITALPQFTGQEKAPAEKDKAHLERGIQAKLRTRENVALNTQEIIRSKDQIKKLRVKLAKLKSAFAGAYKISPARAQILLSQPTGFLGALKGLSEGKMPSREERKKLSSIRSEDAQELLKNIQSLEANIDKEWKKAKKEEALVDLDVSDTIEEIPLDDTVSIKTLRESYSAQIDIAKAEGDNKRASEILNELNNLKASLTEYFPELLRSEEGSEEPRERITILPPEPIDLDTADTLKETKFTPPTARTLKQEKQVIIPELQAQRETPTLRGIKEMGERQLQTNNSIEAFGGGEAGRKYAADLWDHANKIIQEKGNISLQGEKGKFKDALEYVSAFAKNTKLSAEILGQKRSGEIWQEIFDHKTELLKSPSMDDAEKAKLEALDPIYYVTQSALRDKALQDKDLDAAGKHNANIDEINKILGYPEGMNPSTGEGMGKSPRKETRSLGKNRARSDMSQISEKASGISAKSIETGGKKREIINDIPYSVEWAARLLPSAKAEWDNIGNMMKGNETAAKKVINSEIKDIASHIQDMIDASSAVSDEYRGIKQLSRMQIGDPAEATRYVMLKAASELTPVTEDDKPIQRALVEAIADIDRQLLALNIEKSSGKEQVKNQIFKALKSASEDVKKAINPDIENYFKAMNNNNEIKIRSLLGNVSRKLRKNNVDNQTIDQVKALLKEARENLQQAA